MDLFADQIAERRELLQRCLGMSIIQAQSYANSVSDEDFVNLINGASRNLIGMNMRRPDTFPDFFFGQFYTIQNYRLEEGNQWEKVEGEILTCLVSERQAKEVLEYFLQQPDFQADFTGVKARFTRWRNTLDSLLGFKLIAKLPGTGKDRTIYALRGEIAPLIRKVLASPKAHELPVINSEAAQAELSQVQQMEKEYEEFLRGLVDHRLDEVLEIARDPDRISLRAVTRYLEGLFGPLLYFDCLLAIGHQYGMTSTTIVNAEGTRAGSTGFHLALFGAPGTGKTFAVKELMMGDEAKNVAAHGLPGLNRYCGGMTAANFIRIGEAYQGKRFNFVVTEFNDWFRYKGMVEPLKLALEQGQIRYETKTETIGPYQFSCYFATNYNTEVNRETGYKVTIGDPNFNAIEDRMLVRMHRMTKQRLRELSRNQRDLALGRLRMGLAKDLRDHLTLVYAIQTGHPLVAERFKPKQIVLRASFFEALDRAQEVVLEHIQGPLQFSVRVRQNAMKLAGALTLLSYFQQPSQRLEITKDAERLALKFFIEEVAVRQKVGVDIEAILYRLGLSDLNRISEASESARVGAQAEEDAGDALTAWREGMLHELRLIESKYAPDAGWEAQIESLRKELGSRWEAMDEDARQFVSTAEVLLRELQRLSNGEADYCAVVIEYSKALECLLRSKCFDTFRSEMIQRGRLAEPLFFELDESAASFSPSDRRGVQRSIDAMRCFLVDDAELTLGQMWHCVLRARSDAPGSTVFAAFQAHCRSDHQRRRVLDPKYASSLGEFISEFRNAAAHTGRMEREQAARCRARILDQPDGLLIRLIDPAPTSVV